MILHYYSIIDLTPDQLSKHITLNLNSTAIVFDTERDLPIGDVIYCWDFKGIIVNKKLKLCIESKIIENEWANALNDGKCVTTNVSVIYDGDGL